jgi:uncharacterized protein YbbK (DUF523 family)
MEYIKLCSTCLLEIQRRYDGTFSDRLINDDGVTAALLKRNEIKVIIEEDL